LPAFDRRDSIQTDSGKRADVSGNWQRGLLFPLLIVQTTLR
jgi:hypothetical protein